LYLTKSEEKAVAGEHGRALAVAYKVLLAIGRLTNAEKLIPIKWAHVSGVSYLTIGDYGLDFLQGISKEKDAKFRVFTTVNPCGMDIENWDRLDIPADYAEKQMKIINAYQKLGTASSFTCIPFESYKVPARGAHIAWAESSAAIYANSVLDLRTNRESAVSALASALTGKTTYSDLHIDENREPTVAVRVDLGSKRAFKGSLDFGLLGYFAGKHTKGVVQFRGVPSRNSIDESKALCAALGTVGSTGMFTIGSSKRIETIDFSGKDYDETFGSISDSENGEAVIFGCPQMTIEELYRLSTALRGKKFRRKCIVFCSSKIYDVAKSRGYAEAIERAGAVFVRDSCADFTPLISSLNVDSVTTDSVKGAHYMKSVHGVKVSLKSVETIIGENAT
jgi:predicted aconitase